MMPTEQPAMMVDRGRALGRAGRFDLHSLAGLRLFARSGFAAGLGGLPSLAPSPQPSQQTNAVNGRAGRLAGRGSGLLARRLAGRSRLAARLRFVGICRPRHEQSHTHSSDTQDAQAIHVWVLLFKAETPRQQRTHQQRNRSTELLSIGCHATTHAHLRPVVATLFRNMRPHLPWGIPIPSLLKIPTREALSRA